MTKETEKSDLQNKVNLRILHVNGQSIKKKRNTLVKYLEKHNPHFFVVSEHWLKDNEIIHYNLPNYSLATHFCRKNKRAGGIAIFALNSMDFKIQENEHVNKLSTEETLEIASINVQTNSTKFTITGLYRNPSSNYRASLEQLQEAFLLLNNHTSFFMGDMNIDISTKNNESHELIKLLENFELQQMITGFTREAVTNRSNTRKCLDHIYTNVNASQYKTKEIDCNFSDHKAQIVDWKGLNNTHCPSETYFSRKVTRET